MTAAQAPSPPPNYPSPELSMAPHVLVPYVGLTQPVLPSPNALSNGQALPAHPTPAASEQLSGPTTCPWALRPGMAKGCHCHGWQANGSAGNSSLGPSQPSGCHNGNTGGGREGGPAGSPRPLNSFQNHRAGGPPGPAFQRAKGEAQAGLICSYLGGCFPTGVPGKCSSPPPLARHLQGVLELQTRRLLCEAAWRESPPPTHCIPARCTLGR